MRRDTSKTLIDALVDCISPYVSEIVAKGIVRLTLQQFGLSPDGSVKEVGLDAAVIDKLLTGLRVYLRDPAKLQRCEQSLKTLANRSGTLVEGNTREVSLAILSENDAQAARTRAREIAHRVGFSLAERTELAMAVQECALFLFRRGGVASITMTPISPVQAGIERGGVEILGEASAPSITNIETTFSEPPPNADELDDVRQYVDELRVKAPRGGRAWVWMVKRRRG